ncbi:hypothetical protein NPIL_32831 [Nephila pilipes]|uniref:Uncharacterized protein n=1 Tax=Nephila pilipes TaxID=299642 RepID=A0A8X6N8T7_NEPPI|nr:hypothetical protein NPIL_32831 [Nephila pilipes]
MAEMMLRMREYKSPTPYNLPSIQLVSKSHKKKKAKAEESVSSGRFGKLRMGAKTGDQVQEKRSVSQRTSSQSFRDVTQEPFRDWNRAPPGVQRGRLERN